MGQCMSRKAAGALAASAAAFSNKPTSKMDHLKSPGDYSHELPRNKQQHSSALKGVATSFGFKRSVATSINANAVAARRLATNDVSIDRNGNDDTKSLTQNIAPTGRSTPKLQPPKKEGSTAKMNRFGFRQPQANRLNKVTDLNNHQEAVFNNNKIGKAVVDTNRNKLSRFRFMAQQQPQTEKYMLHSNQLPAPEAIRVVETKAAKTLANTSRKYQCQEDNTSKDGSLTEDSGVGSQISSDFVGVEHLKQSPGFVRKNRIRNLEVVVSGKTFDVQDSKDAVVMRESTNLCDYRGAYLNSGFVREKTQEYQRLHPARSSASSDEEPFSNFKSKSNFPNFLHKFSSGSSSDWLDGGEAMADELSFSSSSLDKNSECDDPKLAAVIAENLTVQLLDDTSPLENLFSFSESDEIKRNNQSIESFSKEINEKPTPSQSPDDSKDTNGKLSPGTPTNNSLSLSEGKDDFLIDDEIADQPALVFEQGSLSQNNSESTLKDSKTKIRRSFAPNSPLLALRKNKKTLINRAGSLDTLSPCESIASDDLMMDYEYSQESGLEDFERSEQQSFHDTVVADDNIDNNDNGSVVRDWSALLASNHDNRAPLNTANRTQRLLWSRTGTPNSVPDSPKLSDARKSRHSLTNSPLRMSRTGLNYDSEEDSGPRFERSNQAAIAQEVIGIKTMLLKLKRVLSETTGEDIVLRSETHIPFESQLSLTNGLFAAAADSATPDDSLVERAELKRQILFLQGQIEDQERYARNLEEQLSRVNSGKQDVVTVATHNGITSSNAATQTDRIRPLSMDLSGNSPTEGALGSLVSANEPTTHHPSTSRRSSPLFIQSKNSSTTTTKLWRKPGDPPAITTSSAIPKRASSRTRTNHSSHS